LEATDVEHNILITSVGGQGGITLARVLAHAALKQRLNVRVGETLGMAQRGGSVQSHVRIGKSVRSSLIPRGGCDVLLSLEPSEAVRVPEYLGPGAVAIVNTTPVLPIPVLLGEANYPPLQGITSALERIGCTIYTIDAKRIAEEVEAPTSLNVVVLGAYAASSNVLSLESLRWALGESLNKRYLEANLRAFDAGIAEMKKRK
jgi:indolepyruvate ferredoxin oxidoreductase beta subunit